MKLRLSQLAQSGATTGQGSVWNGTEWVPTTPAAGGGGNLHASRTFITATELQNTLTLGASPYEESLQVFVGGLLRRTGVDYTVSGSVVTLTPPLRAGQIVGDSFWTTAVAPADSVLSRVALLDDNFNRADNSASLGVAGSGQTWVSLRGGQGVIGNAAYNPSNAGDSMAAINLGITDGTITARITSPDNGSAIVYRAADADNCYLLGFGSTSATLYRRVAGAFTSLISSMQNASGDVWSVMVAGSVHTVHRNGAQVASVTDSTLTTGTRWGMRFDTSSSRIDDLAVLP